MASNHADMIRRLQQQSPANQTQTTTLTSPCNGEYQVEIARDSTNDTEAEEFEKKRAAESIIDDLILL